MSTQSKAVVDVFSDFSLPTLVRPIIKSDRFSVLSWLCPALELGSVVEKLKSKNLTFVIPAELKEAIRNGTAYLGSSKTHPGGMTPNIHDMGTGKTVGQGYLRESVDADVSGEILNNAAVFAMLQSIVEKLDALQQDASMVLAGQKDDRLGKVIGSFKSYVVALPTFRSIEEQRNASFVVYCSISEGLYQIHFYLDRLCQNLQDSPENWWKHLMVALQHPFKNVAAEKEAIYSELVASLYNFYNLLILSDIILLHRGASSSIIAENHKSINAFYNRALGSSMDEKVSYLTGGRTDAYTKIKQLTIGEETALKRQLQLLECPSSPLELQFTSNEIQYYIDHGK